MGMPNLEPSYKFKIKVNKKDIMEVIDDIEEANHKNWCLFIENEEMLMEHLDEVEMMYEDFYAMTDLLEEKEAITGENLKQMVDVCVKDGNVKGKRYGGLFMILFILLVVIAPWSKI